jgi:hypothetical protein
MFFNNSNDLPSSVDFFCDAISLVAVKSTNQARAISLVAPKAPPFNAVALYILISAGQARIISY